MKPRLDKNVLKTVSNSENNADSYTPGTNLCLDESNSKPIENWNGTDDLTYGQLLGAISKKPISIKQACTQLKSQFGIVNNELKNKLKVLTCDQ